MHAQILTTVLLALPLLSTATPVPKGGGGGSKISKSDSLAVGADLLSVADSASSIANTASGGNEQQPPAKKTKTKRGLANAADQAQTDLDNVMSIVSHTLHIECFLHPEVCEENDGVVEKLKKRAPRNGHGGHHVGGAGGSLTDGSFIAAACELYGPGACDL